MIRTSGEQRTSNFLPWEAAYAELDFVPELFPDCGRVVLWGSIDRYIHRDRRFGGVKNRTRLSHALASESGLLFGTCSVSIWICQ